MDLDLIYKLEIKHRQQDKENEKYDTVDYFDTYSESAERRNINRLNTKYYDSYESRFDY